MKSIEIKIGTNLNTVVIKIIHLIIKQKTLKVNRI